MQPRFLKLLVIPALVVLVITLAAAARAAVVYNAVPSPLPPNMVSEGFQCCQVSEIGDMVQLAGTLRQGYQATVVMSDWAKYSDYVSYTGSGVSASGFTHPITLSLYADAVAAANHSPFFTVTNTFFIPWRPADDLVNCPNDSAWYMNGTCYHGLAFTITFNLSGVTLPDTFVEGISFNTNTWGYSPLGTGGPYESLNVGLLAVPPSVGVDLFPDDVWLSLGHPSGPFAPNSGWSPYTPAVQFTAYAFPSSADDCKARKGTGWQNLMRRNGTLFHNQGECVSYVRTGR